MAITFDDLVPKQAAPAKGAPALTFDDLIPKKQPLAMMPAHQPVPAGPAPAAPPQPAGPSPLDTIMGQNLGGDLGAAPPDHYGPEAQSDFATVLQGTGETIRAGAHAIPGTAGAGLEWMGGENATPLSKTAKAVGHGMNYLLDELFMGTPTKNPAIPGMAEVAQPAKRLADSLENLNSWVHDFGKGVREYQENSHRLVDWELVNAGAKPDSKLGIASGLVGSGAEMAAKYSNPYGLAIAMTEMGIGQGAQARREGFTNAQAMAKGILSADTLLAISNLPGGEQASKTLAGLIARRGAQVAAETTGFVGLDALVNKLVLDKNMTKEEFGRTWLQTLPLILAMKGPGVVAEGKETVRAARVTKEYGSRLEAEDGIKGKIQDAHARLADPRANLPQREQAMKDINNGWRDLGALAHVDQSGRAFTGKGETVDAAQVAAEALKGGGVPGQKGFGRAQLKRVPSPFPSVSAALAPEPSPEPEPAPAGPEPQRVVVPLDQIRAGLPPALVERFDTDMAPFAAREAEVQEGTADLQRRLDALLKKAKNRAYAQKGKKVTDEDVHRILETDPKTVDEMRGIHARSAYLQVQQDAIQEAKEATADKWRKVLPGQDVEGAGRQQGSTQMGEQPGGTQGPGGEGRGGVGQGQQGQETPGAGQTQEEKAQEVVRGEDRRQVDVPVDVDRRGAERRAQVRTEAAAEVPAERLTHRQAIERVKALERDRLLDHRIPDMANGLAFDRQYQEGDPVASLDVRGLKAANKYGQEVGTEYLVYIGQRLNEAAKKAGLLAAHISGDEFRLTGASQADVDRVIREVNVDLGKNPFKASTANGKPISLRGELHSGVGTSPEAADRAMAAAKVQRAKAGLDPTPDHHVPEALQDVPGIQVSGDVFNLPIESLHADPVRFQHKVQNETTGIQQVNPKTGASGSLFGVKKWNKQSAGVIDVWRDPADGKVYVVNGHNRYDKALELGVKNLRVSFLDAKNDKEAMTQGAIKNLAEGNGTALDAAVYFRNTQATPADLEAQGIPTNKKIVQEGMALASLPDTWFKAAANNPEIMRLAIETGKAGLKGKQADTAFRELHTLLAKKDGDASEISTAYWKDMVDRIKGTQDVSTGQTNMFGDEEFTSTLAEQTDLVRFIQGKLGAEKQAGTVLTGKRYSEAVGKAAQVDTEGAGALKQESTQALDHFKQQKNLTGIGDIINDYAARLQQAGSAKEADAIRNEALDAVREAIRGSLGSGGERAGVPRGEAVPGGGGEVPGGVQAGGLGLDFTEGMDLSGEAPPKAKPEPPAAPAEKPKKGKNPFVKKPKAEKPEAPAPEKPAPKPRAPRPAKPKAEDGEGKTAYSNGDNIKFTGKTEEKNGTTWHEFVYQEGAKKGKTGVWSDKQYQEHLASEAAATARKGRAPITRDNVGGLTRGDVFYDDEGKPYSFWDARGSTVTAHPVVDGKAQVSATTRQLFWINPDSIPPGEGYRTDNISAPKDGKENVYPKPDLRTDTLASLKSGIKEGMGGMSFIPDVVKSLQDQGHSLTDIHKALMDLQKDGAISLRPESGMGIVSDKELALAPEGLQGTRLTWASSRNKEKPFEPAPPPRVSRDAAIREAVPGDTPEAKALRHELYKNLPANATPEDIVVAALTARSKPAKTPFGKAGGQTGTLKLPGSADIGRIISKTFSNIAEGVKGLMPAVKRPHWGRALADLARPLDEAGMLQHPFVKGQPTPPVSNSMVTGVKPHVADEVSRPLRHFRSPSFLGEGPNLWTTDRMMAANHETILTKTYSDVVRDIYKRHAIPDHSERADRAMAKHQEEIYRIVRSLSPLVKEREGLADALKTVEKRVATKLANEAEQKEITAALKSGKPGDRRKDLKAGTEEAMLNAMDMAELDKGVQAAKKALDDFDKRVGPDMQRLVAEKDAAYEAAQEAVRKLAEGSPDTRVALWMEPEEKRPEWLKDMMKPNEIKAADELRALNAQFRDHGKALGLKMLDNDYITHLFKPMDAYRMQDTPEGEQEVRALLDFHHRDKNSINLLPSVHASMAYYIPTIAKKLARQPVLNKWYQDSAGVPGVNEYLDPNSPYHAPEFGRWLDEEITAWQHPHIPDMVESAAAGLKQIVMTKVLAFNQRVGLKHLVTKLANNAAIHRTYMLPAMAEYAVKAARAPENLPFVGAAFRNTTGRVLDWAHLNQEDTKLVQLLTTNLIQRRQIMNALTEDPMIAGYHQEAFNALFAPPVRGAARTVGKIWRKAKTITGTPVSQIEAMENFIAMAASAERGAAKGLGPEEQIQGAINNILRISQRGGFDASRFLKSTTGNILTAFSQTPTKMTEFLADAVKRAAKGERDVYGTHGTSDLLSLMAVYGAMGYAGKKYHLWDMLFHAPVLNKEMIGPAGRYLYHSAMGTVDPKHKKDAMMALAELGGSPEGAGFNVLSMAPTGDFFKDLWTLAVSPKAWAKSVPAVKQVRAELGHPPRGYKDAMHYLAGVPEPGAEEAMRRAKIKKGFGEMRKTNRRGEE